MGFLDFLTGRKHNLAPLQDVTTILTPDECAVFLGQRTAEEFKAFLKKATPRYASIHALQGELAAQLNDFRKRNLELEEGHTRLRKIVESSKRGFLVAMDALLQKTKPPEPENFGSVKAYSLNAQALLEKEVLSFQKNIVYTGLVMKREMKEFGQTLQQFQSTLIELNELVHQSTLNQLQACQESLRQINGLLQERGAAAARLASLEAQRSEWQAKETQAVEELAQLKQNPELSAIERQLAERDQLLARQRDLKNRLQGLLAYIDRPLRRFLKLAESGHYSLDKAQEKILAAYLDNPFEAIRTDPQAKALKKLLLDLKPLLASDQVGLKDDRERERRLASLNDLLSYDFFTEIFSEFNRIESELGSLNQRLAGFKLGEQIQAHEKWLKGLGARAQGVSRDMEAERARLQANEQAILAAKSAVESTLLATLRQRVVIKVET